MYLTIILLSIILLLIYKKWVSIYDYWKKMGVEYIPGVFPFGSDVRMITMTKFQGYLLSEMCNRFPSAPYFGAFIMRKPILVLKDLECIQSVLVKEFSSFKDRLFLKLPENDMLSQHLVNLDGERWHALRCKLSPTFTSGRMKAMFPLFFKCSEGFHKLLETRADSVIDVKDLATRFTTDIISNCAFGLESDAMTSDKSDFMELGKNILDINWKVIMAFIAHTALPEYSDYIPFRVSVDKKESQLFVLNLVENTIKYREENNIKRNDFLDLMMQLKNKGKLEEEVDDNTPPFDMTIERVAAQCFVFYVAGFETSSSVSSFCLYELALSPQVQERVQKEIDEMTQLHAGITYAAIKEMTYLDMVVSETLRKYPSISSITRLCTKSVTLPTGDVIEKGMVVFVPTWVLHYDPQYFPEPEKFDPERFSLENIGSIKQFTYMPFGEGPRFCIGKRFGLLQTKMCLISMLSKYSVEPCKSTQIPIKMSKAPLTTPSEPIKLKLIKRKAF